MTNPPNTHEAEETFDPERGTYVIPPDREQWINRLFDALLIELEEAEAEPTQPGLLEIETRGP
jgi:hypothetical protein